MKKPHSQLQDIAQQKYRQYQMDLLPLSLKRNNLQYYYLGVYPALSSMKYVSYNYLAPYPKEINSLYVHIPFCANICDFCTYFKMKIKPEKIATEMRKYFHLLKQELMQHAQHSKINISYIYFGGGTPSLVPAPVVEDFLSFMKENNFLQSEIYGSMELHPDIFNNQKEALLLLDVLQRYGINRVSIGYQFDKEELLKDYNRIQRKNVFANAIELIKSRQMMFNIDLMYGLPGQSLNDWEQSLNTVVDFQADSISTYFAFADKHTGFRFKIESGKIKALSHRIIQTQQIMAQVKLEEKGFQELPSNFFAQTKGKYHEVKPLALPSQSVSLAIGPGSYSFFNNVQFINVFDLQKYESQIQQNKTVAWRFYEFHGIELLYRDLMFLFKNSLSIDLDQIMNKYGINILKFEETREIFNTLFKHQLIEEDGRIIRLSAKGRLVADEIAFLFQVPGLNEKYNVYPQDKLTLEKYNFSPSYPSLSF